MKADDVHALIRTLDRRSHAYHEFIRAEALSVGLAFWPAGSRDDQTPHSEDEVYYVVGGRGRILVGDDDRPVPPGTVIYVAAGVEHHFFDIAADLEVLVFWAPPRHSRRR